MADLALAPAPSGVLPMKPRPQVPGQAGGQAQQLTLDNDNPGAPPAPAPAAPPIPAPTVAAPSAPVDRLALAQSNFDTFAKSSDPAYQKTLRDATSQAAGSGSLGSGMLRTSLGDAASNRQLQLDTLRSDLVNKATEGSIADAQTAYGQALSGAQQGLAEKIGTGQLAIGKQQADTAEKGVTGSLAGEAAKLELAKTGQAASIDQSQQQIDLAKKTADINAQFQAGELTLAQKDQALKELANTQQNTLQTGQLELAKTGQEADVANKQAQLDLASKSLAQSGIQFNASLAEQQAARVQQGSQFDKSQEQSGAQFTQSLAQNAAQFGLSQQQTQAIAKMQNDTANKSIDANTAQGKNQLLIQLAAIIGGPSGSLNPQTMAAIAKMFGVTLPAAEGGGGGGGGGGGTGGTGTGTGTGPQEDGKGGYVDGDGNPVDEQGRRVKQSQYYNPDPNSDNYNPNKQLSWDPTYHG